MRSKTFVSSANIISFNIIDTLTMSFIYNMSNSGPNTEHGGTSQIIFSELDNTPSMLSHWDLSEM